MIINYDLPIFIFYMNSDGLSEEKCIDMRAYFERIGLNNSLIIPVNNNQETKVEAIWKGKYESSQTIEIFKNKLENLLDIMDEHINDNTLKEKLRNYIIKDLI
jgi:hypothetical protein